MIILDLRTQPVMVCRVIMTRCESGAGPSGMRLYPRSMIHHMTTLSSCTLGRCSQLCSTSPRYSGSLLVSGRSRLGGFSTVPCLCHMMSCGLFSLISIVLDLLGVGNRLNYTMHVGQICVLSIRQIRHCYVLHWASECL